MSNPCIRCGKERVQGKTWKEKVGITVVFHTQTICPDKACQKVVDEEIAERKAKAQLLQEQKEARFKSRKASIAAS